MDEMWLLGEVTKNATLVVADGSEDRLEILKRTGMNPRFLQCSFRPDKLFHPDLTPADLVVTVADEIVRDAVDQLDENQEKYDMVLGFYTVAVMNNKAIPKPSNRGEALAILKQLNHQWHSIVTGVVLLHSSGQRKTSIVAEAKVKFGDIPEGMLEEYVKLDEWKDHFAAYDINKKGSVLIESVNGNFNNILGVPFFDVVNAVQSLMLDGQKSKACTKQPAAVLQQNSDDPKSTSQMETNNNDPPSTPRPLRRRFCGNDSYAVTASLSQASSTVRRFITPASSSQQVTPLKQSEATLVQESQETPYQETPRRHHVFKRFQAMSFNETATTTLAKELQMMPREESEATLDEESEATPCEKSQATPSEDSQTMPLEESQSTPLEESEATPREESEGTPREEFEGTSINEVSAQESTPKVIRDAYSSTFFRATGRPGLYDLRRAGIEPPKEPFNPKHSYIYSDQDDWG